VLALVGLLAYGVASKEPDHSLDEASARGERVEPPAIELPRLEGGGSASLSDWRGKVVVLNYWASWCKPCRDESPLLERWHRRLERLGGTVVGVDVLDVTADAKEFVREYGLSYPMLRDADGSTQKDLGVVAYPETFVLDKNGRIAATRRGPVDDAFLSSAVLPLLDEEPS
jgi:cytochrome c biogenesis protein CcmG/thiol:disulfide interchange protein DsbE